MCCKNVKYTSCVGANRGKSWFTLFTCILHNYIASSQHLFPLTHLYPHEYIYTIQTVVSKTDLVLSLSENLNQYIFLINKYFIGIFIRF